MIKFDISLETEIRDLDLFFTRLKTQAVAKATRQAINRTAVQSRNHSIKVMTQARKLPRNTLRNRIFVIRAKGNDLGRMSATVLFTGLPLPLITFIKGAKRPKRNTGKPRVFEIRTGDKKAKRGLYVAKSKHGKERYQVFRRRDPKSSKNKKMVKQSASSVVEMFRQKIKLQENIKGFTRSRFKHNMNQALTFQLSKLK